MTREESIQECKKRIIDRIEQIALVQGVDQNKTFGDLGFDKLDMSDLIMSVEENCGIPLSEWFLESYPNMKIDGFIQIVTSGVTPHFPDMPEEPLAEVSE